MSAQVKFYEAWIALMRSWGFTVNEAAGWRTRDAEPRTAYDPDRLYIEHHDASTTLSGNFGALGYIIQNKLANICTARDGTVTVVAAGVAWHAGVGSRPSLGNVPKNGANGVSMGNEVANDGVREGYSAACTRSIIAGERAWMIVSGLGSAEVRRILGHKEWADPPGRKSDPRVDMDQRRRDVLAFPVPNAPAPKPAPGNFPVTGAIAEAYNRVLAMPNGTRPTWAFFIGRPVGPAVATWAKDGYWQEFERGAIYAHAGRAHVLVGAILQRFWQLGAEAKLGYPTSDELSCPDTVGRMNHFAGGPHGDSSIYWTERTGAHPVWGRFREVWGTTGWERGPWGYPTSAEYIRDGLIGQDFERVQIRLQPDGKVTTHPR